MPARHTHSSCLHKPCVAMEDSVCPGRRRRPLGGVAMTLPLCAPICHLAKWHQAKGVHHRLEGGVWNWATRPPALSKSPCALPPTPPKSLARTGGKGSGSLSRSSYPLQVASVQMWLLQCRYPSRPQSVAAPVPQMPWLCRPNETERGSLDANPHYRCTRAKRFHPRLQGEWLTQSRR